MSNRDEYVKKMSAKLDEWNAEIDVLEAKARGARADMRIQYNNQIAELKTRRDHAAAKLSELKSASADAWQDLKSGLEDAWHSLREAFKSAGAKFK